MPLGVHVAESADIAAGVVLSPGAVVHEDVRIGAGTTIGSGAVVHAGTVIGAGCLIEDGAVLGKRPRLRRGSSAAGLVLGPLEIADEATVCAGAVVYAGARIGAGAIIGDQAQVREMASIGERTVVGRGSCVDYRARVGDRVSMQSGVYLTAGALVEDDVFLGPCVVTTNDNTMGRHDGELTGPVLRRACRIGAGSVLLPGAEVGEEAFVAAGALVTRPVGPREQVRGFPARVARRIADEELIERWR